MTQFDPRTLSGATVRSASGDKIGTVAQVYVDDSTSQPEWVTVRTGLFGTKESFVPLAASRFDGAELVVDVSRKEVSEAPKVDDDGRLSEQDEAEIYRHYGISDLRVEGNAAAGRETKGAVGHDTSGPNTDDAMTRSEEHLVAGTEKIEAGRARLRKYVVTETQRVDVPVSHEEVRLEREPITDADRDAAYSGGEITDEEHEVTLRAERPVVSTEAEPVERVRLGKETVTGTETVSGEVRKEQIELDDPTGTARDR
ncbi:MAG TPA: PRC and DUF2382 domain-containing protein [Lapillicoccus sp.]